MINLLNPTDLHELKAARINVRLRRLMLLTIVAFVSIGTIYTISFRVVEKQYSDALDISSASEKTLESYETVKTAAKTYQSNLTIAKKILGSEITFSTFITDLAIAMPTNTVLNDLSLSTKSIGATSGKPISTQLTARAKSYNDVLALKTSLEKKTNLFSEVRIAATALSESPNDPLALTYPYTVTFSVVIAAQGATK